MFERFTERARHAVVFAQDEARTLGHNYIGTEHLLLGLLREEAGAGARALESLEVSIEEVRAEIVRIVGEGSTGAVTTGQIPFTPRAKKVLELSLREAISIGHNYIGTEHILLGLARENEGVASQILRGLGADAEKIRNEVLRALSGPGRGSAPPASRDEDAKLRNILGALLHVVGTAKKAAIDTKSLPRVEALQRMEETLESVSRELEALPESGRAETEPDG